MLAEALIVKLWRLPSLDVDKGEGPSLEPLPCLSFPSMLVTFRSSNTLLKEPTTRVTFSDSVFSVFSMSWWMEKCAEGRPRAGGDPVEALADMLSSSTTRQ